MRGLDQKALAQQAELSRSALSRIMSGEQVPKVTILHRLTRILGVTLDFLMDEGQEFDPSLEHQMVTDDEMTILKLARRLGPTEALDRLLSVPGASSPQSPTGEPEPEKAGAPDEPRPDAPTRG